MMGVRGGEGGKGDQRFRQTAAVVKASYNAKDARGYKTGEGLEYPPLSHWVAYEMSDLGIT